MMKQLGSTHLMLFKDVRALGAERYFDGQEQETFQKVNAVRADATLVTWMDLQTMTAAGAADLVMAVLDNPGIMGE